MESYSYLLHLAVILLFTKLLGILTKKIALPQVVGALVAGLLLGPACLNLIQASDFMDEVSELGVIVLMFTAGMETDIKELKRSGKSAVLIAAFGVLIPLIAGAVVACFFNPGPEKFLENLFVGVALTATSVSITVEALKEMGKLSTRSGNAILAAALADDVLGIVALTVVSAASDPSVNMGVVLLKIAAFFAISLVVGLIFHRLFQKWMSAADHDRRRFVIFAFALCLVLSYIAEAWFGVADITGAFIAGLIVSNTTRVTYVANRFETLSFMFLSPVFFANIGLKVSLPPMSASLVGFTLLLCLVAVLSKVVSCGLGARLCGYDKKDSLCIGVGMISRGEVALIVASKGMALGLLSDVFFAPILIMVVFTTVVTPILLKVVYRNREKYSDMQYSPLTDQYEEIKNLDLAAQTMVTLNDAARREGERLHQDQEKGRSSSGQSDQH